jgi:ribosomal protein S27E
MLTIGLNGIGVLKVLLIHKNRMNNNYYVSCPYCYQTIIFFTNSPIYCTKCNEELSDYSELIKNVAERKTYYILGSNKWEMGVA